MCRCSGRQQEGRPFQKQKDPSPAPPSPGRVGGVSDPEIHQRNGFPPRDTPHPRKANPARLGAQDHPQGLQGNKMTPGLGESSCWRSPAAPPGSLGRAPGVQLVFPGSPGNSCVLPRPPPPSEGREKALLFGREAQPHPTLPGPEDGRKLGPKARLGLGRMDVQAACHILPAPLNPSCIPPTPAF